MQVTELPRKERIIVVSRQAMLLTSIPIVILSIIGVVGISWTEPTHSYESALLPFIFTLLFSAAACLMYFVLAIILTIVERINPRTLGMWVGIFIGVVALTISYGIVTLTISHGLAPGLM